MIKAADTDGSGVVEFQEFMDMICDQMEVCLFYLCLEYLRKYSIPLLRSQTRK